MWTSGKAVLFFTADWCQSCKGMKNMVKEICSKQKELKLYKIDIEKSEELAEQFEVKSLPTFILCKEGQEIDRRVGSSSSRDLEKFIGGIE